MIRGPRLFLSVSSSHLGVYPIATAGVTPSAPLALARAITLRAWVLVASWHPAHIGKPFALYSRDAPLIEGGHSDHLAARSSITPGTLVVSFMPFLSSRWNRRSPLLGWL